MRRSATAVLLGALLVLLGAATCAARDPDPYKLLDVSRGAGDAEVKKSYRKLSLRYHPDKQQGKTAEAADAAANKFMKIQKAYETLSDPEKRRNYDMTGFANPQDAWEKSSASGQDGRQKRRGSGPAWRGGWDSGGGFPSGGRADPIASETVDLTENNFAKNVLRSKRPWLIQVYHDASEPCQRAAPVWEQTARSLDGIVKLGRVNIASHPALAAKVAPLHRFSSQPVAPTDLPVVVGFGKECGAYACRRRYRGIMKESALSAFALDRLLRFADVPEHTRDTLPKFLEGEPGKVKFVLFTQRATPAAPLLRRAATEYARDVSFARVHFKSADAAHWIRTFGVTAPPAAMVLKEDGKKIVESDAAGKDRLKAILVEHKHHILPQLRASSEKSTGCRPGGLVQVCVVVVGVQGWALENAKNALRDAKLALANPASEGVDETLATALESKELAFVWVDATTQRPFCRALLFDDPESAAACGGQHSEPMVAAMRFYHGPDAMEYRVHTGSVSPDAILVWTKKAFSSEEGMTMVERGAPNFPTLKADQTGLREFVRDANLALGAAAYDAAEELMYACIEAGPVAAAFVILLILFASTFRTRKRPKRKGNVRDAKRHPADDEVIIEFDEEALRSLRVAKTDMVVMLFVDGMKTDETVFKRLRASFWREPVLTFGKVNIARHPGWCAFAGGIEGGAGKVVIWHPSRNKFLKLGVGDGEVPHPVLCSKIEMILDGLARWEDGDWPSE